MLKLNVIKNHQANILDHNHYAKSAVILPLIKYHNQDCLLFEIRSSNLNFQPGEICFPGGGIEPIDKNPQEAAIRETCEELSLNKANINIIGALDILLTPFQVMIYPFVAEIDDYKNINFNKQEVASIFYVPLEYFLKNKPQVFFTDVIIQPKPNFPIHLLPNQKSYNWQTGSYPVHFYVYQDKIIWGITARIISHFINLIKENSEH